MAFDTRICFLLLPATVCYLLVYSFNQRRHDSRFRKQNSCVLPPSTSKAWYGLPQVIQLVQALRESKFLEYIQSLFAEFGNTFAYNTFGAQSIWTMDPENIEACLKTQSQDFEIGSSRHKALTPLLGHSILTTDGRIWEQHRAMMRPNFVKTQLANFEIFEEHFTNLLRCVPTDNSTFDLRELLQKLTLDISTDFLLGRSTNSLTLQLMGSKDEFSEAWNTALLWIPLRCHLGALMDWIPHPSFFKACKTVHQYADHILQLALRDKSSGSRYIFLRELAKDVTDPIQLRDHAISVLSAGRDTTAELLSCAIDMLTKHGDELTLLRVEVNQLNGEKPTMDNLKDMPYLRNVLFEVLRLYPAGPVNARIACKDTTLPVGGGISGKEPIMVRKGQQVLYSVYGLHRREDLYGIDADQFRPSRWQNDRQRGWEFLPFNGGARNCLGQHFAMSEASYLLVRLLQEFDIIDARDMRPWKENMGLILTNSHDLLVGLNRTAGSKKVESVSIPDVM